MDEGRLIIDPWVELEKERAAHLATLDLIEQIVDRAKIRDGRSAVSAAMCKLCEIIPMGLAKSWRNRCPCHTSLVHVAEAKRRLARPYRKPKNSQHAAQDATAA